MASAATTQRLGSILAVQSYDHDPGSTAAMIVSPDGGTTKRYVDFRDFELFAVEAMSSVATTGITKVEIVAAVDAAGTNIQVIVDGGTVAADAVGDTVWVECTAAQVKEVSVSSGYDLRYIGARITCGNSGDEAVVTYIRANPRFAYGGLTANNIS